MKIIEVPIFNADGSVNALMKVGPEEAQKLLEFAVNFMMATGHIAMANISSEEDNVLKSFSPEKFNA